MGKNSVENKKETNPRTWFNPAWLILLASFLVGFIAFILSGRGCDFLATDFRGYYVAGQITRLAGVAAVYEPRRQAESQATLLLKCPDGTVRPARLSVMVPYLPVFILPFLPLPSLEFTASYVIWSLMNLVILFFYLYRFSTALPARTNWLVLFQWALCFPLLVNLMLGQINVILVIALGEFVLCLSQDKPFRAGLWLGGLMLKPHLLILLLPGLLISRNWKTLFGFGACSALLLTASLFLTNPSDLHAWLAVVRSFVDSSFNSIPDMMNARGMAFNLERFIPASIAWLAAAILILVTALLVLNRWKEPGITYNIFWLMLATFAGTFIVTWHSNLYLWLVLLPFLIALDLEDQLPLAFLVVWILGPAAVFFPVYFFNPELAQPALAVAMLCINFILVVYSTSRLKLSQKGSP
jgi:alpha-1,2-mannosyltransferase